VKDVTETGDKLLRSEHIYRRNGNISYVFLNSFISLMLLAGHQEGHITVLLAYHDSMAATCCFLVETLSLLQGGCSFEAVFPCIKRFLKRYALYKFAFYLLTYLLTNPLWQHSDIVTFCTREHCHPSVLCCCCFGDRKGIRPVKQFPNVDRPNLG